MSDLNLSIYTKRTVPPCKECSDRAVGCHSSSIRYIEWAKNEKSKHDAAKSKYAIEKKQDNYTIQSLMKKKRRRHLK